MVKAPDFAFSLVGFANKVFTLHWCVPCFLNRPLRVFKADRCCPVNGGGGERFNLRRVEMAIKTPCAIRALGGIFPENFRVGEDFFQARKQGKYI